eukprot:scaffold11448_cov18-Tisochrysis_lutea.AAC.1
MNDDEIQAKWSKVGSTCWSDSLGAAGLNNKFQAKWLQQKPSRDSPTARPAGPNNKFQVKWLNISSHGTVPLPDLAHDDEGQIN